MYQILENIVYLSFITEFIKIDPIWKFRISLS